MKGVLKRHQLCDQMPGVNIMSENADNEYKKMMQDSAMPEMKPIEPGDKKTGKVNLLKWLFFLLFFIYIIISHYHAPILTHLGRYLVVEHTPEKSDLIVCLSGNNIERGLAAADAYQDGLAPQIFIAREELPDGYELLKEKGINYPETIDLLMTVFNGLGVPGSALIISDRPVKSTIDEAEMVMDMIKERDYQSLIIITSPTHSRRAWLTFRKIFEKEEKDFRILVIPTPYSKFRPEDWWKKRKYKREVIIEYEKLIYYTLKYFW